MKLVAAMVLASVLVVTSAQAAPKGIPYEEGDPVPPGHHVEKRARKGMVIGGSITFGVSWLVTMVLSGLSKGRSRDVKPIGYIPLVGPTALVATDGLKTDGAALIVLSVVQIAGAGMFVSGLVWKKLVLVQDGVSLTVVPTGTGAALFGTF